MCREQTSQKTGKPIVVDVFFLLNTAMSVPGGGCNTANDIAQPDDFEDCDKNHALSRIAVPLILFKIDKI